MSTPTIPVERTRLTREEINSKQKEYIFPSVTNYFSDPLPMDRGLMQHVWDVEGERYLDFFGGIVTISVGHCNPRVISRTPAARLDVLSQRADGDIGGKAGADYTGRSEKVLLHQQWH